MGRVCLAICPAVFLAASLILAPTVSVRAEPVQPRAEAPAPAKPAPAPAPPVPAPPAPPLGPSNRVLAQTLAERWSKCTIAASERYEKLSTNVGDLINAAFGACKNGEFALRFFLLAEGLTQPAADGVIERLRSTARETLSARLLNRRDPPPPGTARPAPPPAPGPARDPGQRV